MRFKGKKGDDWLRDTLGRHRDWRRESLVVDLIGGEDRSLSVIGGRVDLRLLVLLRTKVGNECTTVDPLSSDVLM